MPNTWIPSPPISRRRPRAARWSLLLWFALSSSAGASAPPPVRAVVEALLTRFHAVVRPCEIGVADAAVCFTIEPGQVALLAEALETFIEEQGGALARGVWSSGNGAHRVVLSLCDSAWGVLELWLVERSGRCVDGVLEHLPKQRE